jgi:hypothetical protein
MRKRVRRQPPRRNVVATVRATCPTCGDVEFGSDKVRIQVCLSTAQAAYSFQCPTCQLLVSKDAADRVVAALQSVGVPVSVWTLPAELAEPKLGPPITHDDLLAFHLALEGDGWQRELAGLPPAR